MFLPRTEQDISIKRCLVACEVELDQEFKFKFEIF